MCILLEFSLNDKLKKYSNYTFIALIPKFEDPQRLSDFRPISLVRCMFKVFAGIKFLMGSLLTMKRWVMLKNRKISLFYLKLTFEKTYDCLEWDYLDAMMSNMIHYLFLYYDECNC